VPSVCKTKEREKQDFPDFQLFEPPMQLAFLIWANAYTCPAAEPGQSITAADNIGAPSPAAAYKPHIVLIWACSVTVGVGSITVDVGSTGFLV